MPHTVSINKKSLKFLNGLTSRNLAERLRNAIDALATNPRPSGCKKIHGEENAYRIRIGAYRIIYEVEDKALNILVVKIGARKDVYE